MNKEDIFRAVLSTDPEEALVALAQTVKGLLSHLGEEARLKFMMDLTGGGDENKVTSMVHL